MIMNVAVQVALVINNYVNPIPLDGAWNGTEWKLYCVYTAWIAVELVIVYFFYVETRYVLHSPNFTCNCQANIDSRGPTLEEIARIFDGDNAEVGAVHGKDEVGLASDRYDSQDKAYAEKQEVVTTEIERS